MKKNHRSILDTAFCSILSAAMFFSLGVTSMAEEGNAEEQPGTEVTETVEAPLPEPEPAPEVTEEEATPAEEAAPQNTVAAPVESTEPEAPAPTESKEPEETTAPVPTVEVEAPAQPEETAVPEPTPEVSPETTPESTPEVTPEAETAAEPTPETEEEETVIYMPAGTFSGSTSQMTVTVSYDDHTFPIGTTMRVTDVSKHEAIAAAEQSTEGDEEVIDAVAVDITFLNANNEEIQPEGAVSVSMVPYTPLETTETSTTEVIHKDDSGNVETVGNADVSASGAEFSVEHFSIYVIKSTSDPAIARYIFHDADGKEISTQKVKNGETVYAPTTPEKSGYKFLGWSTNNGPDAVVEPSYGGNQFSASVSATGDVNLYPVFQQVYYVFFLDGQGRVSTTKEGVSKETISVTDVTIPLDSTHSVTGWYTEAEKTNKVESVTLSDHNVTLYPNVEEGHYLYFVSGEGASYVKPVFVEAGKTTTEPEAPTRPGYTFKHWSATENGSEYEFGSRISEDATLHAVWEANLDTQYTVIYWWENANDDNYSYHENSTATGITGSKIDLDEIKKDYDGFTRNAEKTNAANADAVIAGDGSTIVNVYYSRNIYEIKFFKAEQKYNNIDIFHWFPYWSWDEISRLSISAKYGANISNRWPTYYSKIWGTQKGANGQGEGPYQSGISTMPLNGAVFYYVSRDGKYTMNMHYYLEGLDGTYNLHHTDSFSTNNSKFYTTAEDHYDIEGFTYTNNVKDGTNFQWSSKNVYEITFKYKRNDYSIKFVNGDSTTSKTFKYGADISKVDLTAAPERPTYVFAGWFDNELGVGEQITSLSGTMPANNITLYAKWVAPTYDGTIHLTIEDNGKTIPFNVAYGQTIDENDMPQIVDHNGNLIQAGDANKGTVTVPQGNTWAGWATKTGDGSFVLFNFNTKVHGNITFYPYYINGEKYRVTYNLGSVSGEAPTDSKQYAENSYADIQSAAGITPPKDKTFLYWSDSKDDKYYPGDKVKITGDLVLTAVYGDTSALTSITYYSNYPVGSGLAASPKVVDKQANNTAITLEKAGFAAPTGYYFAYWKDGSGNRYDVGTNIGIDNTSANAFYAVWEQKKEITLTANSETITYDGTEHTASGVKTNTFKIDDVIYTVSGFTTENPKETNAGTYTNNISGKYVVKDVSGANVTDQFTVNAVNGTLTISKRPVTITSGSNIWQYDGKAHSEETATASTGEKEGFVGSDGATYSNFKTITNKGTAKNTFEYTLKEGTNAKNYEIKQEYGQLEITAADEVNITITGTSGTKVYDGTLKSVSGFTTTELPAGITVALKADAKAEANGTNAGEYPMGLSEGSFDVGGTENYTKVTVTVNDGTLTISKRPVTITSGSNSWPYDGNAHSEESATAEGFVGSDGATYSNFQTITNKGTVNNTFDYTLKEGTNADNYDIKPVYGKLEITAADAITITITGNSAEIDAYDGKLHSVSGFTVTAKKTEQSSGAKAAFVNFVKKLAAGMPKLNINVSAEEAGNADRNVVTVEGVPGITVALKEGVEASASGTDAGTYSMNLTADSFDITGTENYANVDVVVVDGTLKINPAPLKVTTSSAEKVYDGKALTASGKVEGLVNGETVELTTTGSQTDVGTSTNTYSINWEKGTAKQKNYKVTEEALGTLKVTARPEPSKPKPAASNPAPAPVSTRFIPRTAANPAEGK